MGYHRAGFDVVGVDIVSRPDYPFDFVKADALEFLDCGGAEGFDVIHASPPCQAFTRAGRLREAQGGKVSSPDLLEPVRERLRSIGKPYIIENVPEAPLIDPLILCGSSFGLRVRRHRAFETRPVLVMRPPCNHGTQGRPIGVYHVMGDSIPNGGRTARTLEEGQLAMGIDWMQWPELKEAIPPVYTEFIGKQLLERLNDGPSI